MHGISCKISSKKNMDVVYYKIVVIYLLSEPSVLQMLKVLLEFPYVVESLDFYRIRPFQSTCVLFELLLFVPVNKFSAIAGRFLGWTSTG